MSLTSLTIICSLLNKLTLENFDSVSEQIIAHITSLDLLSGIITQVFDKALSEPHFCPMYVQCTRRLLSHVHVTTGTDHHRRIDNTRVQHIHHHTHTQQH